MQFTRFPGVVDPTTTGSFSFDSQTGLFSDFLVTWGQYHFNVTSEANTACSLSAITGQCFFDSITHPNPENEWEASITPVSPELLLSSEVNYSSLVEVGGTLPYTTTLSQAEYGSFVTEIGAQAPEPSSFRCLLIGTLILGGALAAKKST